MKANAGMDVGKWEHMFTAGGNKKYCTHYKNQHKDSSKKIYK